MKTFRIELDDENNPMDLEAARFEAQIVERERQKIEFLETSKNKEKSE